MLRIPAALAHVLLALGSLVIFHGSTCAYAVCVEDCDPCYSQCLCHTTCQHPYALAFEPAHRLIAFDPQQIPGEDGTTRQVFAWIDGLAVPRATGRAEVTPRDLREFAEGVLGVNHELLDLDPALGHWEFVSVELAGEFALVSFAQVDAAGHPAQGTLEFVFDVRGKLLEIDRALAQS
jgi:hypothetical protein